MSAFEEYGVMPEIIKAVQELDWLLPTDVQAEAIPLILGGGDVLMAAETGSGKTGAFCLPVLQIVHEAMLEEKHAKFLPKEQSQQAILSPSDRDSAFAIAEDGILCQSRDPKDWQGARATIAVAKGKYYYEAVVTDEGLCRVGWSTISASRNLGTDKQGFGFGGTGKKSFSGQFETYGEAFGLNDTIGCYIDMDTYTVGFSKNGKDFGKAFDIPVQLRRFAFYPAVVLKNAEMRFNFGNKPLKFLPAGYSPISQIKSSDLPTSASQNLARENKRVPLALILEPSRELAQQTYDQIMIFKKHLASEIRADVFVGGSNAKDQMNELKKGMDIVIGTPGRLDDLMTNGNLDLSQIRFLILDEADGLLAQGHRALITKIYNCVPKEQGNGRRLQMIVCSATLHSNDVRGLALEFMHFPTWIDLKGKDAVPDTVHQALIKIAPEMEKSLPPRPNDARVETDGIHIQDRHLLKNLSTPEAKSESIKRIKPQILRQLIDAYKMDQAIIFCRTKVECDHIKAFLLACGSTGGGSLKTPLANEYSCVCLHSDVQDRARSLNSFKSGEVRFLICTDVAARGIDVSGLPFVINITLPEMPEDYIHRIGRVGRADRMGLAISLVSTVPEKVWYHQCPTRGKKCNNTRLKSEGGCAIWYDEPDCLNLITQRIGQHTITELQSSANYLLPMNMVDGKISYGVKRGGAVGTGEEYESHTDLLAPSVIELSDMESSAQHMFWTLRTRRW